jgi:GNAT superfamily N-acetyltransferase
MKDLRLEIATAADVPVILRMIKALAEYERLADQVVATEAVLTESLFGPTRRAEVVLAYAGAEPVGFAVFFHTFSTFLGRHGMYLEDLFVVPDWRGRGIGRTLFVRVAQIAVERGCGRMEWSVLDWNEPAIGFYRRLGGREQPSNDWLQYVLEEDGMRRLAEGEPPR